MGLFDMAIFHLGASLIWWLLRPTSRSSSTPGADPGFFMPSNAPVHLTSPNVEKKGPLSHEIGRSKKTRQLFITTQQTKQAFRNEKKESLPLRQTKQRRQGHIQVIVVGAWPRERLPLSSTRPRSTAATAAAALMVVVNTILKLEQKAVVRIVSRRCLEDQYVHFFKTSEVHKVVLAYEHALKLDCGRRFCCHNDHFHCSYKCIGCHRERNIDNTRRAGNNYPQNTVV